MSGYNRTDNSLATGIKATHIGPETGNTGSATAGGESGAGTREQTSASASSTDINPVEDETLAERRSFEPHDRHDAKAKGGPREQAADEPLDIEPPLISKITDGHG